MKWKYDVVGFAELRWKECSLSKLAKDRFEPVPVMVEPPFFVDSHRNLQEWGVD